jgi:hypothetical protein
MLPLDLEIDPLRKKFITKFIKGNGLNACIGFSGGLV